CSSDLCRDVDFSFVFKKMIDSFYRLRNRNIVDNINFVYNLLVAVIDDNQKSVTVPDKGFSEYFTVINGCYIFTFESVNRIGRFNFVIDKILRKKSILSSSNNAIFRMS